MVKRAAIILAGGKGKRFQSQPEIWQDKALAPLFGKPLLVHAIERIRESVNEVVVCVNDDDRKARYTQILGRHGIADVELVVDEKFDHMGGPLVAIYSGLKVVEADSCFTLPGDMPLLDPKIVEHTFSLMKEARVVVPMWPNGRLETLTMALERASALDVAQTLCLLRRPRTDDLIRGTPSVTFVAIVGELNKIDPELKSFVNINFPEDLAQLQPRRVQGAITKNIHTNSQKLPITELWLMRKAAVLCGEDKLSEAAKVFGQCADSLEKKQLFFWAALSHENEGKANRSLAKSQNDPMQTAEAKQALLDAARNYGLEAKLHAKAGSVFLTERARSDQEWCQARVDELKH